MNKDLSKRITAMILAGGLTLNMTGCSEKKELGADTSSFDVLTNSSNSDTVNLNNGVEQILDVKNNDFKLVLNFFYDTISLIRYVLLRKV